MKEGVKIITSKDHAAAEVTMDHWTLHMDKFQEGKEPLFQRTNEFFDLNYQKCKGPVNSCLGRKDASRSTCH